MSEGAWADDVRPVDRGWRVAGVLLYVANIVVAIVELTHYSHAHAACPNLSCSRAVTDALDSSQPWLATSMLVGFVAMILPTRRSTTSWRVLCVAVLTLATIVRIGIMAAR